MDIQSAIERPMNIVIEKFECQSVRWVTAQGQNLTVTDCVFDGTSDENGQENNLEGVMKGTPATALTVNNCKFKSAGRYNIIIYSDKNIAAANIDITDCEFSNWGYRAANGLRSDAWLLSIKVSKIEGICYSETDRAAFVKRVKDNNTFTPLSKNPQNIPIHTFIINAPGMNPDYYLYD